MEGKSMRKRIRVNRNLYEAVSSRNVSTLRRKIDRIRDAYDAWEEARLHLTDVSQKLVNAILAVDRRDFQGFDTDISGADTIQDLHDAFMKYLKVTDTGVIDDSHRNVRAAMTDLNFFDEELSDIE